MKTRTTTTVSLTDKRQTPWQNLRQLLLCLLILLPGILTAQTIENPTFKARNGSIRNITRIERTPNVQKSTSTRFSGHTGGSRKMERIIWKILPPEYATSKRELKALN